MAIEAHVGSHKGMATEQERLRNGAAVPAMGAKM